MGEELKRIMEKLNELPPSLGELIKLIDRHAPQGQLDSRRISSSEDDLETDAWLVEWGSGGLATPPLEVCLALWPRITALSMLVRSGELYGTPLSTEQLHKEGIAQKLINDWPAMRSLLDAADLDKN